MTEAQLRTGIILGEAIAQCTEIITNITPSSWEYEGAKDSINIPLYKLDQETRDELRNFFMERRKYLEDKFKEL